MEMIVIVSDNKKEAIGMALYDSYKSMDKEVAFISASSSHVKPCYGCNGCLDKTYGKCVFRDDMDDILPILIKGDIIIYTSPLVWGGFSYNIKKILDKTALIGNRFYSVRNKEMVKGTISKMKKIVGIGVSQESKLKGQIIFENLLKETGIIMNIQSVGRVVDPILNQEEVQKLAMEVLL